VGSPDPGDAAEPTSCKALARRFFELLNGADPTAANDIIADTYVEHALAPFGSSEPGVVDGPAHVMEVARSLREQFPDLRVEVQALVTEGDFVTALITAEGTNLGPINGVIPPTGRSFSSRQSHWFRVEGAKLAEHWATRDDLTTMLQLGLIPRPGPPGAP